MAAVFDALGHSTRRRILDLVKETPGCSVGQLAAHFDTTRIAVMHHLRQLEACRLIISERKGRSRLLYHNSVPIQMIYDRWTTEYSRFWAGKLADVKYAVETKGTSKGAKHGAGRDVGIAGGDPRPDRGRVA